MFGVDFYPTPKGVIEQMLQGTTVAGKVILEPSAGSGNIVDYVKEFGAKEVIACEVDIHLRVILNKKCRIIESDFMDLTAENVSHIDMIVMNPPFSRGEEHILKAWEVAPAGCEIIALCNESTVKNPFSSSRQKLNEIIKNNGSSEDFGSCFSTAERKTNVNVSCVRLYKPNEASNEFDGYFDLTDDEENKSEEMGIMPYNYMRDIVGRFIGAIQEYDNVLASAVKLNSIAGNFIDGSIAFTCTIDNKETHRNTFKKELQKKMWRSIFNEMNMHKYVTRGVMSDINKFVEQQVHVPFTVKNIYKMIDLIIGTHSSRMDKVLVEAFETICSYSHENSTGGEGWKTNSDYVINKRFIKPYMCEYRSYSRNKEYVGLSFSSRESIMDVVKALCYLTGMDYENVTSISTHVDRNHIPWGKWSEWGFFRIRGYMKGTMHFEFVDDKILELFNRRVAEIKGWRLPKSTSKARAKSKGVSLFDN